MLLRPLPDGFVTRLEMTMLPVRAPWTVVTSSPDGGAPHPTDTEAKSRESIAYRDRVIDWSSFRDRDRGLSFLPPHRAITSCPRSSTQSPSGRTPSPASAGRTHIFTGARGDESGWRPAPAVGREAADEPADRPGCQARNETVSI